MRLKRERERDLLRAENRINEHRRSSPANSPLRSAPRSSLVVLEPSQRASQLHLPVRSHHIGNPVRSCLKHCVSFTGMAPFDHTAVLQFNVPCPRALPRNRSEASPLSEREERGRRKAGRAENQSLSLPMKRSQWGLLARNGKHSTTSVNYSVATYSQFCSVIYTRSSYSTTGDAM